MIKKLRLLRKQLLKLRWVNSKFKTFMDLSINLDGVRQFTVTYSKFKTYWTLAEITLHWKQLEESKFEVLYIVTTEKDNYQYLTLTFAIQPQDLKRSGKEGKNDIW